MTTFGVDYAWGWPSDTDPNAHTIRADIIRALQAAGVKFTFRYFSHDAGKNLSRGEAQALSDAGISIGVVWETAATRAADGYPAGVQDAHDALAQAQACGMPSGRPIYFAVDYDANPSEVEPYFQGVKSVLGAEGAGVYGGVRIVKALLDAQLVHWAWQADAWSYGNWDPRAHVRQGGQHTIGGVDCDDDTAMAADFGQWRVGVTPTPQEDDMPQGQLNRDATKNTPISIPAGRYKGLGFAADNGFLGHKPVKLRVAQHIGKGNWHLDHIVVDSAGDKTAMPLLAAADQVSITYEDDALVPVGWDMS